MNRDLGHIGLRSRGCNLWALFDDIGFVCLSVYWYFSKCVIQTSRSTPTVLWWHCQSHHLWSQVVVATRQRQIYPVVHLAPFQAAGDGTPFPEDERVSVLEIEGESESYIVPSSSS